jgi:hypothetical protein
MRYGILALLSLAIACSSLQPLPVRAGDACFRCRRVIDETRLAGEIIGVGGQAFPFRTPGCMAQYLGSTRGRRPRASS